MFSGYYRLRELVHGRSSYRSSRIRRIVPIPGTRSAKRVEQNINAVNVNLTEADLQRIKEILPHGSAGSRYPAGMIENFTRD
ncbi:aldo/keto reductase [Paenibacillus illinoisensis]|uniref:aldo/keto reductase n=1 Tax=Paenibacillus illinoisensis TaxID=59845 RepID=UPI003D2B6269